MTDFPLISLATSLLPRWTYVDPIEPVHDAMSRHLILQGADRVRREIGLGAGRPLRALVIGAGRCHDIPLRELCERFDEVVVTDIDKAKLTRGLAREKLQAEHHRKLTIEIGDVVGVADQIESSLRLLMDETVWTPASASVLVERMAGAIDAIEPNPMRYREPFDLVVASCVLSQLHLGASDQAVRLFKRRLPDAKIALREQPVWIEAIRGLAGRLQPAFVELVLSSARGGGGIYLSSTPHVRHVYPAANGRWKTRQSFRMIVKETLAEFVDRGVFTIESQAKWEWADKPPRDENEPGFLFGVEGMVIGAR